MVESADSSESRTTRARARREHRGAVLRRIAIGIAGVAVIVLAAAGAYVVMTPRHAAEAGPPLATGGGRTVSVVATPGASTSHVEVPNLVGMPLVQARALLTAAGLVPQVDVQSALGSDPEQAVHSQTPDAGVILSAGGVVTLAVPMGGKPVAIGKPKGGAFVVVIDPGHQSHADAGLEPVGPGSKSLVAKMTGGATGVATRLPECELMLQVATNLKDRLEAQGVRVVMTRTTNDVSLSNAQRAQIANSAKAALYVTLHADAASDASSTGVTTIYPVANVWTKAFVGASRQAASQIQGDVVTFTGARDGGALSSDESSVFDWARVPVVMVEVGNLANPVEDRLLSSATYQDKLAGGVAQGITAFLHGGR